MPRRFAEDIVHTIAEAEDYEAWRLDLAQWKFDPQIGVMKRCHLGITPTTFCGRTIQYYQRRREDFNRTVLYRKVGT